MTEVVALSIETPLGQELGRGLVRIWDSTGATVLSDRWVGVDTDVQDFSILELEPGDYLAWVRCGGYHFAYPETFTVEEGDGPSVSSPLVVTFQALGKTDADPVSPLTHALVWGNVDSWEPAAGEIQPAKAPTTTVRSPLSRYGLRSQWGVLVKRLTDAPLGEEGLVPAIQTLRALDSFYISCDLNGYYEFQVREGFVYMVSFPDREGYHYFKGPDAGTRVELSTLLTQYQEVRPYDVVRTGL